MLVAGRVVSGLSVGIASATVPIYQSEITPPAIRGRLVSLQQWSVGLPRSFHHLSLTRHLQVYHMGYLPPVLRRIRLLVPQWHAVLPYSLGSADDSCCDPVTRHDVLPRSKLISSISSSMQLTMTLRVHVGSLITNGTPKP